MTSERQPRVRVAGVRYAIKAALFALVLAHAAPVAAQDFNAGVEAYQRGDYAAALREWRPLAEQGAAQAQHKLGLIYHRGVGGVPRDYAEAFKWYSKAVNQGFAEAQTNIGIMYVLGQGVAQDNAEAARRFRMAAEQGVTVAQYLLGDMYESGQGVPQSNVLAYVWWSLAASQGHEDAASSRNRVAGMMTPEQITEAQKLAREWRPK